MEDGEGFLGPTSWAPDSSFDYTVGHKFDPSAEGLSAQTAEGMGDKL